MDFVKRKIVTMKNAQKLIIFGTNFVGFNEK